MHNGRRIASGDSTRAICHLTGRVGKEKGKKKKLEPAECYTLAQITSPLIGYTQLEAQCVPQ